MVTKDLLSTVIISIKHIEISFLSILYKNSVSGENMKKLLLCLMISASMPVMASGS